MLCITTIAVATAVFYAQSDKALAKEYAKQSQELDSEKIIRARQYSILMRIPASEDLKKATQTVEKMTDKQVLDEFSKLGE